jgi:hypothetical protein
MGRSQRNARGRGVGRGAVKDLRIALARSPGRAVMRTNEPVQLGGPFGRAGRSSHAPITEVRQSILLGMVLGAATSVFASIDPMGVSYRDEVGVGDIVPATSPRRTGLENA